MMRNEDAPSLRVDVERVAREIAALHTQGQTSEALALAERAASSFPGSALAHVNLGYLRVVTADYPGALDAYDRALQLDPAHPEARRGRAVARRQLGEDVVGDSISIVPFTGDATQHALDVVILLGLGGGNVVIDELFDSTQIRAIKLMVDLHGDAPLPDCDLIFNGIGDVDAAAGALERATRLLRDARVPVLNDPAAVAHTGRAEQAARLALAGARTPWTRRIPAQAIAALSAPVLVRAPGFHAGRYFERIDSERDRERVAAAMPPGDVFAIEWIDTSDREGLYAKYRVVFVGGVLYPAHLAISRDWKVHYFSAEMASSPSFRARERAFLDDPAVSLGAQTWALLGRIAGDTNLTYGGIDFAIGTDGELVVFECNATMAVRYPPDEEMWSYRRPAVDAIRAAMRKTLADYSST
jgi:tetratricopeptide (TPR) repeat protein